MTASSRSAFRAGLQRRAEDVDTTVDLLRPGPRPRAAPPAARSLAWRPRSAGRRGRGDGRRRAGRRAGTARSRTTAGRRPGPQPGRCRPSGARSTGTTCRSTCPPTGAGAPAPMARSVATGRAAGGGPDGARRPDVGRPYVGRPIADRRVTTPTTSTPRRRRTSGSAPTCRPARWTWATATPRRPSRSTAATAHRGHRRPGAAHRGSSSRPTGRELHGQRRRALADGRLDAHRGPAGPDARPRCCAYRRAAEALRSYDLVYATDARRDGGARRTTRQVVRRRPRDQARRRFCERAASSSC